MTRRSMVCLALLACTLPAAGMTERASAAASPKYVLAVSKHPDRSRARLLAGQTYSRNAKLYVFVTRAKRVKGQRVRAKRVRFYIDVERTGRTRHVDRRAPFDFTRAARALHVSTLSATSHTILAAVRMSNRKLQYVSASFTVTPGPGYTAPPQPRPPPRPVSPLFPAPPPPPPAPPPPPLPPPSSTLRFADEFDGSSVDATKWSMWNGPGHDGHGLRRPSAFSVSDGVLVVAASMVNGQIQTGGMNHRADYTYGRYEFRVRTERDPTATMSGIVMTWPQAQRSPEFTENDMYETGPYAARDTFDTFIHYGYDVTTQKVFTHHVDATQWHTVVMDWRADALKIYRDGVHVWTVTDKAAIPDVLHHVNIQLDARATRTLTTPVRMYVDYIRIYD